MQKYVFGVLTVLVVLIVLPFALYFVRQAQVYIGRANVEPASILVDTNTVTGPLPHTWQALAQGGEEYGVQMLHNVIPQVRDLYPRYVRIDHIYDFYNVVSRDSSGKLTFAWGDLDRTVCDILDTGARPFFSLGYMPSDISIDGSLISQPKDWNEWTLVVQKTIERYSGRDVQICGGDYKDQRTNIYYEVWNEPDLESFGKWSLYRGEKDYKVLYKYSSMGAARAQNVRHFFLGGPATTAAYRNWLQVFLEYADEQNLRVDFLSWHHYSQDPDNFGKDVADVRSWLKGSKYDKYRNLPLVISEWGYDSEPNPVAHKDIAAAHAVVAVRNLVAHDLELAFMFEIKDGVSPSWGILSYEGEKKPRYYALSLLNMLGDKRLAVSGEGSHVRAIAAKKQNAVTLVLVNYDVSSMHAETVPITLRGLDPERSYLITQTSLRGAQEIISAQASDTGVYSHLLHMEPNTAYSWEIVPRGD